MAVLSLVFLRFALEYASGIIQGNQEGMRQNQLLVYSDYINLLGENRNTIQKNTQALLLARKWVSVKVNTDKTNYMSISHEQNARQNHNIKIATTYFENVAEFKYLRMTVTNQNLMHEEIKKTLYLGNVYYHSNKNFYQFQNIDLKMCRAMIFPTVLCVCET
jgi:hypothetical protein